MSQLPRFNNLINGQVKPAASGAVLDSINPSTGEVWAQFPACDATDVQEAVAGAKAAFPAWSALAPEDRSEFLKQVGAIDLEA